MAFFTLAQEPSNPAVAPEKPKLVPRNRASAAPEAEVEIDETGPFRSEGIQVLGIQEVQVRDLPMHDDENARTVSAHEIVSFANIYAISLPKACQWEGTGLLGTGLFPADHSCAGTMILLEDAVITSVTLFGKKSFRVPYLSTLIYPESSVKQQALGKPPENAREFGETLDANLLPEFTARAVEMLSLIPFPDNQTPPSISLDRTRVGGDIKAACRRFVPGVFSVSTFGLPLREAAEAFGHADPTKLPDVRVQLFHGSLTLHRVSLKICEEGLAKGELDGAVQMEVLRVFGIRSGAEKELASWVGAWKLRNR